MDIVNFSLTDTAYKQYAIQRNKKIPHQKVCKVCGSNFAAIELLHNGIKTKVLIQVPNLLKNKEGIYPADREYICNYCTPFNGSAQSMQGSKCSICKMNRDIGDPNLSTTTKSCCESGCDVFPELIKARKAGLLKKGALIEPCENCVRYWREPNSCIGIFEPATRYLRCDFVYSKYKLKNISLLEIV